jgi:hypothetical protein
VGISCGSVGTKECFYDSSTPDRFWNEGALVWLPCPWVEVWYEIWPLGMLLWTLCKGLVVSLCNYTLVVWYGA